MDPQLQVLKKSVSSLLVKFVIPCEYTHSLYFSIAGNASQVSDGAAAVLLMKRKVAVQKGLPILGIFRYAITIHNQILFKIQLIFYVNVDTILYSVMCIVHYL